MHEKFRLNLIFPILFFLLTSGAHAFEVFLDYGAFIDIPEAWRRVEASDSSPSWYSPDNLSAAEVTLEPSGTYTSLNALVEEGMPKGATGDVAVFPCWGSEAALADWTFTTGSGEFRGWFLFFQGEYLDTRVSAITSLNEYQSQFPLILSVIDSFAPSTDQLLSPGAVSRFLTDSDESPLETVIVPFGDTSLSWVRNPAEDLAAQDFIEREALVLNAYQQVPELFYQAWTRYYRLIFRDSYSRMANLAAALKAGPLPPNPGTERVVAEQLLEWLQSFSFGSTDGFSDLLAPSAACAAARGDCDSLAMAYIILMHGYGIEGRLLLSHQAAHALAALDLNGPGLRYVEGEQSFVVAELTSRLPLGRLPERLNGVSDWYGIRLIAGN